MSAHAAGHPDRQDAMAPGVSAAACALLHKAFPRKRLAQLRRTFSRPLVPNSGRGLAVVSAKAEGVTGWVEKHSDVLLRLVRSHRCSECNGLGDRAVEVADLEVEVHHRTLLPIDWRPYGGLVAGRLLEHDEDGSRGRGEDGRTWFLVPDGPAEQPGVEPGQCAGVRRLDGGSPPHALLPRLHLAPHSRRISLITGRSLVPRHDQHARSGSGRSPSGFAGRCSAASAASATDSQVGKASGHAADR